LILVTLINLATTACGQAKDLNRTKAQTLIVESTDFKQPAVLALKSPAESEPFGLNKSSKSEKVEDAKVRNLQLFLSYYPRIAAAAHLGLATIDQELIREEKAVGVQVSAQWFFSVKTSTTEQGKKMWKEYGSPASDVAIPLARKEFVNITGITSPAENQALAEFTWKWNSNKAAHALQENTDDFKALPADIQQGLLGRTEGNRQNQTEIWDGERKGKALFQRYDDGWRLVSITNY